MRFSAALEAKIYDFFVLLGVSKNELRYMKPEKKISLLFLCVAMLIIAGCRKDDTPAEEKTPVGFRAMSQVVVSKDSDGTSNKLPDTVEKFGVWGVAGNDLNIQYLWNSSTLTDVNRQSDGITYVPSSDGYWFSNSIHDFLALASDPSTVALPSVSISHTENSNQLNPSMTFTYDMSSQYDANSYTYDLLGAAARHVVERSIPASQDLNFWHLFSQIEIEYIRFDTGIDGKVTKILLKAYPSGTYTIDYDNSDTNPTKPTGITPDVVKTNANNTPANKSSIVFEDPHFSVSHPIVNIIPQEVADLELYIDFTINEGTEDNPIPVRYEDFKINLNAQELTEYDCNGKYIWKITIGTRNSIKFDVSVTDWDQVTDLPEIDM